MTDTPVALHPDASGDADTSASILSKFSPEEQIDIYNRARRRAWARMSIMIHAIAYVLVVGFLTLLNLAITPDTLWVIWPAGGWGFGLFCHWLAASHLPQLANEWEEREIIRELERR